MEKKSVEATMKPILAWSEVLKDVPTEALRDELERRGGLSTRERLKESLFEMVESNTAAPTDAIIEAARLLIEMG